MLSPFISSSLQQTKIGQWTPHATDLYNLLILIFSDGDKTKLGDLEALRTASNITAQDWEDLLQYTTQACHATFFWRVYITLATGFEQPRELQVFRLHQDHPPHSS